MLIIVFCAAIYSQVPWNDPLEPFKIADNVYYVGASDLTSYLITTPKGHILIDGGSAETAAHIKRNIVTLGFKLEDIKIILNSHAHTDHAGGIPELKKLTGAVFYANPRDNLLLENGGLGDPNYGNKFPFEKIKADRALKDHQKIKLGGMTLKANFTPGHTPGCTTWTTNVKDKGKTLKAIFVCSVSSPDYKLVGNEKYPTIESDYRSSFAWLKTQKPDIFLAAHGSIFGMMDKIKLLNANPAKNPFIDPQGYKEYVESTEKSFNEKLAAQKAAKLP